MSGVKDFVVHILAGAGLLLMLSACQTSKHAEVTGAEDLPEQAQELGQERDEPAIVEEAFGEPGEFRDLPATTEEAVFGEPVEFQDEPVLRDTPFMEESVDLQDEPAVTEEAVEEPAAELQDEPAATQDTFFEGSEEFQDEPAMMEEAVEEPAGFQDEPAMMEDAVEEPAEFQDEPAMIEDAVEEPAEFQDEPAMMEDAYEEPAGFQDEPAMIEDAYEEPAGFQDEPAMMEDAFGETMDSFEDGGVQMMPSEPMEDGDHIEEMDTGMMTDSERVRQDGTAFGLSHVFFKYDSYEIGPGATAVLRNNARILNNQYRDASVLIEGHCDERGTVDYNVELGKRRAQAVKDYLVDLGVGESRISIVSYGKERPFCMESEPSCWAQNRRGHFLLRQ